MIGLTWLKYLLSLKLSFSSWLQFSHVNRFDQNSSLFGMVQDENIIAR